MKNYFIPLIFVILLASCKKKNETVTNNPETISRKFYFNAFNESYQELDSITANTFIINFYQNNNVVYSVRTKKASLNSSFNINDFKDGGYICEIKDSLNLFGYYKDSVFVKNNTYYLGVQATNYSNIRPSTIIGHLGNVIQKPTYLITNYRVVTDSNLIGGTGIYIYIKVSTNITKGSPAIYWYKNNTVSFLNEFTFGPVNFDFNGNIPNYHLYSSATSTWIGYPDFTLKNFSKLKSGDSLYFAIYPAPFWWSNNISMDKIAPITSLHNFQYTSIGSQKIVIPYKLR